MLIVNVRMVPCIESHYHLSKIRPFGGRIEED
jgi:hypothetical protein